MPLTPQSQPARAMYSASYIEQKSWMGSLASQRSASAFRAILRALSARKACMSRFIILASLVIGSLSACGDSASSSGSGVTGSKRLSELTSSERDDLCSYSFDASGGAHSKMCGGGITISTQSVADCTTGLAAVSASCAVTVDTAESCAEAIGSDLCNTLSSSDCLALFVCVVGSGDDQQESTAP